MNPFCGDRVTINAPREKVWGFLTDPTQLTECAPGLESLEVITPNEKFRAVASIKAPDRARMKIQGKAPGSVVDGTSEMKLSDGANGSTVLDWSSDIKISGTIASLAARLMGPVTQKLTDTFFTCVRQKIEGR